MSENGTKCKIPASAACKYSGIDSIRCLIDSQIIPQPCVLPLATVDMKQSSDKKVLDSLVVI